MDLFSSVNELSLQAEAQGSEASSASMPHIPNLALWFHQLPGLEMSRGVFIDTWRAEEECVAAINSLSVLGIKFIVHC